MMTTTSVSGQSLNGSSRKDWQSTFHGFSPCTFKLGSLNKCLRSIGVSNFTVENLQKLLKIAHIKPAVNQVSPPFIIMIVVWTQTRSWSPWQIQLHPYNYAESTPLLEYHSKHGIVTEAYGSLAFVFHLFHDMKLNRKYLLGQLRPSPADPWTQR